MNANLEEKLLHLADRLKHAVDKGDESTPGLSAIRLVLLEMARLPSSDAQRAAVLYTGLGRMLLDDVDFSATPLAHEIAEAVDSFYAARGWPRHR